MSQFTPVSALLGGALIGTSASLLMLTLGRVSGISGILHRMVVIPRHEIRWRLTFVAGLLLGGLALLGFAPSVFGPSPHPLPLVALSGLLVGVGTRLGNGCTSGHGVCGNSRLSPRSLTATAAFMATGMITVRLLRAFMGGAL